jgi:hypothetical protein
MALQGLVDWRGHPVNQKKQGGVRASVFIHCKYITTYMLLILNLVNVERSTFETKI